MKIGEEIDIRLAMDATSGMAQDGAPKFFRASRLEGDKEIPLTTKPGMSGGTIRQGIVSGHVTGAKARYTRTYQVTEFDLIIGGMPFGVVQEIKE